MADFLPQYSGDANLGVGSTPAIPATENKDLNYVQQIGRDIMMQNASRNLFFYNQKLKEKDKLLELIDAGEIKVPDILEQDEPIVDKSLKEIDTAYIDMMKNGGLKNIEAVRKYKKAVSEANRTVTQAVYRKTNDMSERDAIGKETIPDKRNARNQNLDNFYKNGFWADWKPYQNLHDLNIQDDILKVAVPVTKTYQEVDKTTGLPFDVSETTYDFGQILRGTQDNYLNNVNAAESQRQLLNNFTSRPTPQVLQDLSVINKRINEYNTQRGLKKGDEGFVVPVIPVPGQNGQISFQETPDTFAAKYTLAHQDPFSSKSRKANKDLLTYDLGKERNRIAATNAAAAMKRANAYAKLQGLKAGKMTDDEKRVKGFWDAIVNKVKDTRLETGSTGNMVFLGDLPQGYQNIGGLDKDGKPIKLEPLSRGKDGRTKFYQTRFYNGQDGAEVKQDFLKGKFKEFKNSGGGGSYDDYLRQLVRNGVLDLELIGKNGTANFESALQTARALSNKVGAGKEEPVFSETETITEQEE